MAARPKLGALDSPLARKPDPPAPEPDPTPSPMLVCASMIGSLLPVRVTFAVPLLQ